MANETTPTEIDIKTRANLSYMWTGAIILLIGYALYEYGHILAVLTLIIGFVTGTASTILSPYFGSPIGSKKADTPTVLNSGDNTVTNVTPTPEQPVNTNK